METRSRYTPLSSKDAWERLLAGSKNLSRLERLSDERLGDAEARQVSMAVDILNMEQPSGKQKRYKEFLYDVLSNSSPPFVLLSAIALGQARVASMTISNRSSLISKIKDNKDNTDMNHTTVQSLAIKYLIPNSVADLPPPQHTEVKLTRKRKRKSMADPHYSEQTSESAIRHPGDTYEVTASTAPPAPEPATGFIGDIYELTPEDALAVVSDICGPIWLTDPYDGNTQPFVNISISWTLLDQFISQRRRIM
ncbi:hypothetical protein V496_01066 [Pseudogymnoascus sp. VKM F-4515 (FW-2607)]|nr:hypothetical protein V496_01066 [Pseudogymnoascus sp. VKM F-4515 (FW-2607)]